MIEARIKTKIPQAELEEKKGKILTGTDLNLVLTGPSRLFRPDGKPMCVYLPGALKQTSPDVYPILTAIRMKSDNRGLASGTKRINAGGTRTRAMPVLSGVLGAIDPTPRRPYCRLNAYSREHLDQWHALFPLLQKMSSHFEEFVPDRHANQARQIARTPMEWYVPGTVFTTITVNNTYSTGVHIDGGDLDEGFSCLAVFRRGNYTGGLLTFPEYRVGVDMRDGDLILMDAHQWHGNTAIFCSCGHQLKEGPCDECDAERISVVAYYRTKMAECASKAQEDAKMHAIAER